MARLWLRDIPVRYEIKDGKIKLDIQMLDDILNEMVIDCLLDEGYDIDVSQTFKYSNIRLVDDMKIVE